jgi:hypothetical protein
VPVPRKLPRVGVTGDRSELPGWGSGFLFLPTVALLQLSGFSCSGQATSQGPELAGIAHAAIRVTSLARSRDFYGKLGYEEAFAMDQNGVPTESFIKINDHQFIELYPQREPSQAIGFMHVCFEAGDLEGLNRFYGSKGLAPQSGEASRGGQPAVHDGRTRAAKH